MPDKPHKPDGEAQRKPGHPLTHALFTVALALALLLSICITVYIVLSPHHDTPFTEFYLLGNNGKADDYPKYMTQGQQENVTVAVVNHEYRNMDYKLSVILEDGAHNNTQYVQNLTLANTGIWQKTIPIEPRINGTQLKLDFLLYANGNVTAPYRECYLYINVTRPWYYDVAPIKAQFKKWDRL